MTPTLLKKINLFIEDCEGCKFEAYSDVASIWTIGIGTTIYPNGEHVKKRDKCTRDEAEKWLDFHLSKHVFPSVSKLCSLCTEDVPESVYVALCSFAYNVGAGFFVNPSFTEAVRIADWGSFDENNRSGTGLVRTFLLYTKITVEGQKVFSQGLYNRRVKEIKYMLEGL